MPVPGYVAEEEGPTTEAAKRGDVPAGGLFVAAARSRASCGRPLITEVVGRRRGLRSGKARRAGRRRCRRRASRRCCRPGPALHGFASLEAYGHLDWLEPEARDELFRSQIRLVAKAAGLPVPAP